VVARRHFERGERAYAVGRFRVAIDHYRAAYEALPLPQFLFNLAQCHRNLKEYEQAVFFYRKYLERHPQAEDREKIVYTIGQLERLRASSEQHERQTRLLSPAPARREEPRSSRRALWITGGVVAAVGAGALTFFLWPRAPSGDLGRIDLSLRGGR
jgi:tetratricopeptide (TPR) repeat protein